MAYSAGTAYLEVVPSFLGLEQLLAKGARDIAKGLDKALGNQLGQTMKGAAKDAERETGRAAEALGKTFAENAIKRINSSLAHIPAGDRILSGLRKELTALSEIDLGKGFNEKDFIGRVERAYDALRKAQQDAQGKNAVGRYTNAGNAAQELGAVKDIVEAARKRGFAAGDSFSDAYQGRLKAMDRALPDFKITAAASQEERAIAALKQRIQDAMKLKIGDVATRDNNPLNLKIGAKIDGAELKREMEAIEGLLDQFSERFSRVELVLPLDKARQQAGGFFEDIKTQEQRANEAATRDYLKTWDAAFAENAKREREIRERSARQAASELERSFRQSTVGDAAQRVTKAADRIIDLPVHLRANDIDHEMAGIRERVKSLGNVTIGVDFDAETFADKVRAEFDQLDKIAKNKKLDIEVRTDAARAATELGGVLVLLGRIDGKKAEVKIDTDSAVAGFQALASELALPLGRLGALIAIGASLGTVLVPAAAAATSAIGSLGTAALAAGSGIGVLLLGFSGIGDAVKAMGQYADNTEKSSVSLAKAGNQVEAANQQIHSAEMALANTRRNNANAAIKAQQQIKEAILEQRDAVRDVARQNQLAVERVGDAQRALTQANLNDLQARQRLNDAYRDARRALEDLNSQLRGNALNQRQATLDIAKAKTELDKMLANPRATAAEREQADITYQQRLLQMDDLKRKGAELADEQDKRFKVGVNQSDEVVKARRDIANADQAQLDAQRNLTRAQQDQLRAVQDGAEKLRKANQRVADARTAAADQQKDAAYSEFTATQSLISARRALENATNRSAIAGGAQLDNLNTAMGKLSPTAQKFARYIFGMRDAFYALRDAASPVLAGVQKTLESFLGKTSKDAQRKMAPVFDFVGRVATKLGELFIRFGELLKGPTFTRFFEYISKTAVPTLDLLYRMFEYITVGVVNLFLAFTPLTGEINDGFLGMTESFRKWSEGLETNAGFQKFIAYMRESAPEIGRLLREMVKSIGSIIVAAAPVGTIVAKAFGQLFEWINKIPQKTLTTLVAGIAAAAAALGIFGAATSIIALGLPGVIALIGGALIGALGALVSTTGGAAEIFAVLWDRIKTGATIAFGYLKQAIQVLKPVFDNVIEAAVAFYRDGLKPIFDDVVALFVGIYEGLKPAFGNIGGLLVKLGGFFFYLYDKVILPVYEGILTVSKTLFQALKPVFKTIGVVIGSVAAVVFWLLDKVFLPVIGGITKLLVNILGPTFKFLWRIIKPIIDGIGIAFQVAGAIIQIIIGLLQIAFKGLGIAFSKLGQGLVIAWQWLKREVFDPLGKALEPVGKAWDSFMGFLGKLWDRFMEGWRKTLENIQGLIDKVLGVYNGLAKKLHIGIDDVQIKLPGQDKTKQIEGVLKARTAPTVSSAANTTQVTAAMRALNTATKDVIASSLKLTPAQQALADAQKVLGDKSSTAQDKVQALKKALDAQRDATRNLIDSDEEYHGALLGIKTAVQQARAEHDKNATSLKLNSETGLRNRDALEALVESANKAYEADVDLNGVTDSAIESGKTRIQQIRDTARMLGLNKTETEKLITAYGRIPENVETAIGFKSGQFDKMFQQLEQASFIQEALRKNQSLKDAKQAYQDMVYARNRAASLGWGDGYGVPGYATGGPIRGRGGKTADDKLIWASSGEFMQQAKAVDHYGLAFMHALNNRLIPKDVLPGFAKGGPVNVKWPFPIDVAKTFIPSAEDLQKAVYGGAFNGVLGAQQGGRGWQWQMATLHKVFKNLALISGFRKGSRTLSGNQSYHALGRAVDLPPIRSVAEWIARNYGATSKELITPWRDLMLHNGKPHKYSRAIEAQHGVFGKNAHVHWAYDKGGELPDTRSMPGGVMQVFHGSRTPDKVLTDQQWKSMATLAGKARESMAGGNTYTFPYRDSTLDYDELNRWSARQDALNRVNRANY